MKEAFLAAIISAGPTADNEIRLFANSDTIENNTGQELMIKNYVPATDARDTKADSAPHIVRHITANQD